MESINIGHLGPGVVTSRDRDMNEIEARLCVQRINAGMNEARKLLLDLYERKGWKALGYPSWRECAIKEFGKSASQLYRQMEAAIIEREISPAGEKSIPEKQLRPLAGLETEQKREAWTLANDATGGKPTEATVRAAVEIVKAEPIAVPIDDNWEEREEPRGQIETVGGSDHIVARGAKEIIARAKEIKERLKSEKREARKNAVASNGKTFDRVASIGSVEIHCADSRRLHEFVAPGSVQLVITSPPYNVGVDYANYDDNLIDSDYAALLQEVFAQCFDALCDGGRIAVVVPFGGYRNPWKPIASVVMDHLCAVGFSLVGQIVWDKGDAKKSNTAWGSFRLPTSPCLRDTTECVAIAAKGSGSLSVPSQVLLTDNKGSYSPFLEDASLFLSLTEDHWPIQPENSERIGHPAPFPVELAARLIRLYAYPGATILDPFSGSGTVGVAAKQLGCKAILSEIDAGYCALARDRCEKTEPTAAKPTKSALNEPGWKAGPQAAFAARMERGKGAKK